MSQFAVYSDANCSNLVTGDTVEDVNADERVSKYLCLDAGDYWIQFKKDDKDLDQYIENGSGEFRLSVAAEYLNVNGTKLTKNDNKNMGVVNFKITTVKKGTVSKVTNAKGKKAKVSFNAISGAKGYEVQYDTNKNFSKAKVKTASAKAKNVTIKSLKKNKKYYVRVRAFKYNADGNKVYGEWSDSKTVTIKNK